MRIVGTRRPAGSWRLSGSAPSVSRHQPNWRTPMVTRNGERVTCHRTCQSDRANMSASPARCPSAASQCRYGPSEVLQEPVSGSAMSNNEHTFADTNRHLVEVPDSFAVARWSRNADVATIARCIVATLKYEPHTADITVLRQALFKHEVHALQGVMGS